MLRCRRRLLGAATGARRRDRDRKVAAIAAATDRSGATVVASANPGCAMHLAAAGVDVRHPVDLVAEAVLP